MEGVYWEGTMLSAHSIHNARSGLWEVKFYSIEISNWKSALCQYSLYSSVYGFGSLVSPQPLLEERGSLNPPIPLERGPSKSYDCLNIRVLLIHYEYEVSLPLRNWQTSRCFTSISSIWMSILLLCILGHHCGLPCEIRWSDTPYINRSFSKYSDNSSFSWEPLRYFLTPPTKPLFDRIN